MSADRVSALPLAGIKVIDFGQYMAGPAVAMLLADLGATVIHVDPPGGPLWDSPCNATLNRNKRLLRLDLKTAEGVEQARALIDEADVVIENFRPGVMARLGLCFQELRAQRPELITLSLPGFASNDTKRRDWRAFESIIAASSGVFTDMGLNRVLMGINPSFSPLPLASSYGTVLGASAVALALQARERSGLGDHVEVPLVCALMEGLCYNSIRVDPFPERYKTQREREIERRRIEGLPMNLDYAELQELLDPFYRSYLCKDGRMFYVVCPGHRWHARRCLQALDLYDELVAEGLAVDQDPYQPIATWDSEACLGVYPLPKEWADRIAERMKAAFLTRTSKEWEKIFGRGRFPGAPQRWLQEWINDDHAETAGLMLDVHDPIVGAMTQPGPIAWLEDCAESMLAPVPGRSVTVADALAMLQARETKLPRPRRNSRAGGWLDGVRILDLCNVIAGPHAATFLARFGAEVIKIDPAEPLYDPGNTVVYGLSHMRSKRSALVDLRSEDGRPILDALIRASDIVIINATDRQVRQLGLDITSLERLNPSVLFCQLDCFGGPRPGPRTNYLGYDDLIQATTGIMLRFGGGMNTPEEHAHVGTIDVMCGFGAAFAIAIALFRQRRTGQPGRARTSLAALSGLAQLPFCYDYTHRPLFSEPAGRDQAGFHALSRFYATSDSHVLICAELRDLPRFEQLEAFAGLSDLTEEEQPAFLAAVFITARAEDWVERLQGVGIGAAVCESLETLRAYHMQEADGRSGTDRGSYAFSCDSNHPSGRTVTQLDPYAIRPQHGIIYPARAPEHYGQSTRAVLYTLGFADDEINAMVARGSVAERWSDAWLPD